MLQWWYSQDEERWGGPEQTRQAAIDMGIMEYDGEAFSVVEAEPSTLDFNVDMDDYWDGLDDRNCDRLDRDSEMPIADRVSDTEKRDLEAMLEEVVAAWSAKHNIDTDGWTFDRMGPVERIAAQPPEET